MIQPNICYIILFKYHSGKFSQLFTVHYIAVYLVKFSLSKITIPILAFDFNSLGYNSSHLLYVLHNNIIIFFLNIAIITEITPITTIILLHRTA